MDFSLTDEQKLLKDSIRRFLDKDYTFEARRALVEKGGGFGRDTWKTLADLGLLGLAVPEAQGGLGGTVIDTALVMEEFGRSLLVEPYAAVAVMSVHAIEAAATAAQKEAWLPAIAAGESIIVMAHEEPDSRGRIGHVRTTARRTADGGHLLHGHKTLVQGAPFADRILVSARVAGGPDEAEGLGLFMVDAGAAGLVRQDVRLLDGSPASDLRFDGVAVPPEAVLGEPGQARAAIAGAVERMIVALCAEAVGAMDRTIWITRDYLKTRKQFGTPIGKFQVLQHRMADMCGELEMATSMAILAACVADQADGDERSRQLAAAKFVVVRAARLIAEQAIQLHGGIGMTWEYSLAHHAKRLVMLGHQLGDDDHHLQAYAELLHSA